MTDLPEIAFDGEVFTPGGFASDVRYEISLAAQKVIVAVYEIQRDMQDPQIVINYHPKESKVLNRQEVINAQDLKNRDNSLIMMGVSAIANLVACCIFSRYLTLRDLSGSLFSAVALVGLTISTWYFSKQADKATFNIANQAIRVSEGSDVAYNPSHYGL